MAIRQPSLEFITSIVKDIVDATPDIIRLILDECEDAHFEVISLYGLHQLAKDHFSSMTSAQQRSCNVQRYFLVLAIKHVDERQRARNRSLK